MDSCQYYELDRQCRSSHEHLRTEWVSTYNVWSTECQCFNAASNSGSTYRHPGVNQGAPGRQVLLEWGDGGNKEVLVPRGSENDSDGMLGDNGNSRKKDEREKSGRSRRRRRKVEVMRSPRFLELYTVAIFGGWWTSQPSSFNIDQ